ncbi:unnamed protein product, partial [Rotaria sordida]
FAWYYFSICTNISFIDQSIQQKTLNFVDSYYSSCKSHQQGNINLIISALHSSGLKPNDLSNRTSCGYLR